MKPDKKHVPRFIVVFSLVVSVWGCASMFETKPNIPYRGTCPEAFRQIQQKNSLLAAELLKLPEIQDGISADESIALERIFELYNLKSTDFDAVFDEMYHVGLPDVRRYCSPF